MNRAEAKFAFDRFRDRLACSSVVDATLGETYVQMMKEYLVDLEGAYEAIDVWSVEEYEGLCEYLSNNDQWVSDALAAKETLAKVHDLLVLHKAFLSSNGVLPSYLDLRPSPAYQLSPSGNLELRRT